MRRRLASLIGVVVLGLVFATCGGDTPTAPAPAPTTPSTVTPAQPQPTPLSAPAGLWISGRGEDFIEWSWTEVENASGYEVQFSLSETFGDDAEIVARTVDQLSHRRDGLPEGASGHLRVRATDGTGEAQLTGAWSGPVTGMTTGPPPPQGSLQIATGRFGVVPDEYVTVYLDESLPTLRVIWEPYATATSQYLDPTVATWATSDPTIIELGTRENELWGDRIWTEQVIELRALRPGRATVTANFRNQTDYAFFEVLESSGVDLAGRSETDRPDDISGPQIHAVYVIPSDGVDEQLDLDGTIATSLEATRNWMAQESGMLLRLDTYRGDLDVTFLQLDQSGDALTRYDNGDVIAENLRRAGLLTRSEISSKIYVIYYVFDEVPTIGAFAPRSMAVVSDRGRDAYSPSPNAYGETELTVAHELLHTFGAVPSCAPNHIPGAHVSDDYDVMGVVGPRLPRNIRLDVDRDDYFGHGRSDCLDTANSPFWRPMTALEMTMAEPMTPLGREGEPWQLNGLRH